MTQIALLPDGRLHLQHGPIDCLVQAWGNAGEVQAAYRQATDAFPSILPALCGELTLLRQHQPATPPEGDIARAMHDAVAPFRTKFITPMAAVAGAVADAVLAALTRGRDLDKAYVNNGGDIAFHLTCGQSLRAAIVSDLAAPAMDGAFRLDASHPARGLATSGRACKGRGGKSFSFGVADSVSVLARNAAMADVAATIIGNAVDLPGHRAVVRRPASDIDPDSDLGDRLITWDVGPLSRAEIQAALEAGMELAETLRQRRLIEGAVLCLRGQTRVCGAEALELA